MIFILIIGYIIWFLFVLIFVFSTAFLVYSVVDLIHFAYRVFAYIFQYYNEQE